MYEAILLEKKQPHIVKDPKGLEFHKILWRTPCNYFIFMVPHSVYLATSSFVNSSQAYCHESLQAFNT